MDPQAIHFPVDNRVFSLLRTTDWQDSYFQLGGGRSGELMEGGLQVPTDTMGSRTYTCALTNQIEKARRLSLALALIRLKILI
jgi:hypothetical protein